MAKAEPDRYIYRTQGVCPPEIHFQIEGDLLKEVRFVGGGCPGNAQLVSRLLQDRPWERLFDFLDGCACKNKTSCPDQLAQALRKVQRKELLPARSFRIVADVQPRKRLALVGELGGKLEIWKALIAEIDKAGVDAFYCLGNLVHPALNPDPFLKVLRKERHLLAIQGETDWTLSQEGWPGKVGDRLGEKERAYLTDLGQVIAFQIGSRKGLGFFGGYLQGLPGYSDFEPFALEMNLVANLTRFMEDETVFPALEAMIAQFSVQVVVFSQRQTWGHWQVGGVDFISLGPALQGDQLAWGMLEEEEGRLHFRVDHRPWPTRE